MATPVKRDRKTKSPNTHTPQSTSLPLVITLNCIEDTLIEQQYLTDIATINHVSLSQLTDSPIESAAAVLLHSLAYLPRAAQRRLRPHQLVLCLGSSDSTTDSALAADLGLRKFVHVDVSRAEEIADTVMALLLGLLRRTHLLSRGMLSASGWLGSVQPLCRGMRRCSGLVLGIIGVSGSAKALVRRSLAFNINVLYYDVDDKENEKTIRRPSIPFPPTARRMDTLNDLLAASDLISLHCELTDDTIQVLNADCLQRIKPGAFLVNTGSSQLLDDCAVKQLLINGTLVGCAFDGAEGPQWMEAWVREMPNVLILPCSADYSDEAWMEIREKSISILQTYFLEDVIPTDTVSNSDEEEIETLYEGQQIDTRVKNSKQLTPMKMDTKQPMASGNTPTPSNITRSSKKPKKRHTRRKPSRTISETSTLENRSSSYREDGTAMSGTDSLEDFRSKKSLELLEEGCVISLLTRDRSGLHISRQRGQGGGWFLDTVSTVTRRDPAAQFLVEFRNKDTIGLRSFTAGGKLLQINSQMEFVFASPSFDTWESWTYEGSLEECRLVNPRYPSAVLSVRVEILATVGDDGITPWHD